MKLRVLIYSAMGCGLAITINFLVNPFLNPPSNNISAQTDLSSVIKKTITAELENPWSMAFLPDETILVTERAGKLRLIRNGILEPRAIAGLPTILAQGQAGLMDVSLHPEFSKNRLIYFTYSHGTSSANRTRLARAKFDGKSLSNLQDIFEVSQIKAGTQHYGSRVIWLKDGTLLLAIGDGGNPPVQLEGDLIRKQAQNLRSNLGKIMRLNDDGSIPKDNPFNQNPKADAAIWSYGHRNIQGLALDALTNKVWSTEHGALGGDELNLIQGSKNYGWPLVTFSREYTGGEITATQSKSGMVDPIKQWTPAIAPSGLVIYNGDRFPQWRGNLFAGGLVSRDVRRLVLNNSAAQPNINPSIKSEEIIPIGQRVRDVKQSPDGFLYVLTDQSQGELIRLGLGK
jgi:aldose sugar dehydrogenase